MKLKYNLRKSEYWMNHADVLLFVFFKGPDNASIGIEIRGLLDSNPGVAWHTIMAYYEDCPSLIEALGERYQPELSMILFKNKKQIAKQTLGTIIQLLERLNFQVSHRFDGEWEYSSI